MREETRRWWEQAQADLEAARHCLAAGDYAPCAFLCQQGAEKALKALFPHTRGELPLETHNLRELGQALGVPPPVLEAARRINPAYATARYPDAVNGVPAKEFSREIAEEHIRHAQTIVDWVAERLGREPPSALAPVREPRPRHKTSPNLRPNADLKEFSQRLRSAMPVERLILFGSRARGDALRESDYDLVIVSPAFAGKNVVDRAVAVLDLWKGPSELQPLCYTPAEFKKLSEQITIVAEAVREGIEL